MEAELAGRSAAAPADRGAAGAIQPAPALGQALYTIAGTSAIALCQAARFSRATALLRSPGQVPQRVPRYIYLWMTRTRYPILPVYRFFARPGEKTIHN